MINSKDIRNKKIIEALDTLNLSDDTISELIEYIEGEKDEEVLKKLSYSDLTGVRPGIFEEAFRELLRRGRKEEIGRLFNIVFEIGQSTCYNLIPMVMIVQNNGVSACEPAKKAAVYAMYVGVERKYTRYIYGSTIDSLISIAGKNPQTLKDAVSYDTSTEKSGRLILLAAYFMTKYTEDSGESKGLLSGIGKMLGIKGSGVQIDEEDKPLMKEYEEILIGKLHNVFEGRIAESSIQEITNAVCNDRLTEQTLKLAGSIKSQADYWLRTTSGLAYLNYKKSKVLRNIVKVCLSTNITEALTYGIAHISRELPVDISITGGEFDREFGIDSRFYIDWAAQERYKEILKAQLKNNHDLYLKVMDEVDMEKSNLMFAVIKENYSKLYNEIMAKRTSGSDNREMEKMINLLAPTTRHEEDFKQYLRGKTDISSIYPYIDEAQERFTYRGTNERRLLVQYHSNYSDAAFFRRCKVVMALRRYGSFFRDDIDNRKSVKALFDDFNKEKLDTEHQFYALLMLCEYSSLDCIVEGAADAFEYYLKDDRESVLKLFSSSDASGRYFGLCVLRRNTAENKDDILKYAGDTSKVVKEELLDILYGQKDWEDEIINLLDSKKAAQRETAIKVLLKWQGDKDTYKELFIKVLEKEKNAKVMALLDSVLDNDTSKGSGAEKMNRDALVKELHKGGKKRSLAWAYETPFSAVHMSDGSQADEEYLQAVLLCYASAEKCGVSKKAEFLAECLNKAELAGFMNELFEKWLDAGAEAKKRWVLYAAAIHGGADIIQKLQHQIQEWPQHARGAIAAEAVQALALNPLPQALLIVDGISRKFKFRQVKAAAGKALEFAASQLGLTTEELADKIVPDLGFDENMERIFDYGTRTFKVTITTALEIEVFDENGKKLKNLPAPGKKDDQVKAAEAYNEFKLVKKQMKTTISSQKQRLEFALSIKREWAVEAWKDLFVKNPIMHQFAIGLIWGIYEDNKLVQSFRYMEDGSFNTEDEDEYELPENGKIGLVHPIELAKESKEAWKQQLEDYEITQPIEQLDRPVFYMTDEEAGQKHLERFDGRVLNDLSLGGRLLGMGWYRGSIQDAGGFDTYYREDAELSLGVELHFSGSFVGGENGDVTVYDARFYKAGTVTRGSYVYDEADDNKALLLKEIPARYFSEIVLQLTKATA